MTDTPSGLGDRPLSRAFFARDTVSVARALLGVHLVREEGGVTRVVRIVETEAYLGPHDLASHASKGRTQRNAPMFGPPGRAYVYLIYGLHHCFNVVTEPDGIAGAVLVRAAEPLTSVGGSTSGPGRLCRTLGIDRSFNGHDLLGGALSLVRPPSEASFEVVERPRVGVAYAQSWAAADLRFYIAGNPFVSKK